MSYVGFQTTHLNNVEKPGWIPTTMSGCSTLCLFTYLNNKELILNLNSNKSWLKHLLIPKIVIQSVPSCKLASWVDQHRICWRAVLWKLLVCIIRTNQSQFNRIQRICHQNFLVESSIDHGCLWTISSNEVNWFWWVLFPFRCVCCHNLA